MMNYIPQDLEEEHRLAMEASIKKQVGEMKDKWDSTPPVVNPIYQQNEIMKIKKGNDSNDAQ